MILTSENARSLKDKNTSSVEQNDLLRTVKYLGRILWKSLVETKIPRIKLLGNKLMARSSLSQVIAIHARVAALNIFTELGAFISNLLLKFDSLSVDLSSNICATKPL